MIIQCIKSNSFLHPFGHCLPSKPLLTLLLLLLHVFLHYFCQVYPAFVLHILVEQNLGVGVVVIEWPNRLLLYFIEHFVVCLLFLMVVFLVLGFFGRDQA